MPLGPSGDEIEEASGCVLDKTGRVFQFWLGWDPAKQDVDLIEWEEVTPEPHWLATREYRRAREAVGLPAE